jgi:alginate lyase
VGSLTESRGRIRAWYVQRAGKLGTRAGVSAGCVLLVTTALFPLLAGHARASDNSLRAGLKPHHVLSPLPRLGSDDGRKKPAQARWYLTERDLQQIRRNVVTTVWARTAWQRTQARADAALSQIPHPANPQDDFRQRGDPSCADSSGWYCGLYLPGLRDGQATLALALAYVVSKRLAYAEKAKTFLLAWARHYNPPPPDSDIGHMVAEPVGFMIKGFMAYDLVKGVFSQSEQAQFRGWAHLFVGRGKRMTDFSRDRPWVPQAPYGNSATWSRALALVAAAVVGGPTFRQAMEWNWSHTTSGGNSYSWIDLIDGAMHGDGRMVEEDVRRSIFYGLFTLHPLMLIATVASNSGYTHDLWRAVVPGGKGIYRAIVYYAPYLTNGRAWPAGYTEPSGRSHDSIISEYRAVMETAANFLPGSNLLRNVVGFGGSGVRGSNEDLHISGFNALTGGLGPLQSVR